MPSVHGASPNPTLVSYDPCRTKRINLGKLQELRRPLNCISTLFSPMMIVRSITRVQAPKVASRRIFRLPNRPMRSTRRYSTANAPQMASSTPQSQASMLATITTDLDKIAPRFEIQPEQITIIKTPAEFYETLKVGSSFSFHVRCFHTFIPSIHSPRTS